MSDPAGTASDYTATVNTGDATLTSTANPSNVVIDGAPSASFTCTSLQTGIEA